MQVDIDIPLLPPTLTWLQPVVQWSCSDQANLTPMLESEGSIPGLGAWWIFTSNNVIPILGLVVRGFLWVLRFAPPLSQVKVCSPALWKFCHIIIIGYMYSCTVNVNSRVVICMCTLAAGFKAFSPAALWIDLERFRKMRLINNNYYYYVLLITIIITKAE